MKYYAMSVGGDVLYFARQSDFWTKNEIVTHKPTLSDRLHWQHPSNQNYIL